MKWIFLLLKFTWLQIQMHYLSNTHLLLQNLVKARDMKNKLPESQKSLAMPFSLLKSQNDNTQKFWLNWRDFPALFTHLRKTHLHFSLCKSSQETSFFCTTYPCCTKQTFYLQFLHYLLPICHRWAKCSVFFLYFTVFFWWHYMWIVL